MSYHNPPKRFNNTKKTATVALSVIALLFAVQYFLPQAFSRFSFFVARPFWNAKDFLATAFGQNALLQSKDSLIQENNALRKENNDLNNQILASDLLTSENKDLKALLGVNTTVAGLGVPIIQAPTQSPYDLLVASVPADSHIAVGNRVVEDSLAIGTVEEMVGTNAKIRLYSSAGIETQARLVKDGTLLTLVGSGGGNFTVSVPRDMKISIGDLAEIVGDTSYVLARVANIESRETNSFKTVQFITPVNMFSLPWVLILYEK